MAFTSGDFGKPLLEIGTERFRVGWAIRLEAIATKL